MGWKPKTFDEACRRAAGRRAYNRKRRLERARRISAIFRLLDRRDYTGRELAALLGVHEATISRDLRFIRKIKREWERDIVGQMGFRMYARNFFWGRDALSHGTTFLFQNGVRVR
jgi:hypothetical protein